MIETMAQSPKPRRGLWIVVVSGFLGFFFDAYFFIVISYMIPLLRTSFHVSAVTVGTFASAGLIGALVGSLVWGPLADRMGRRAAFSWTVLTFGVFSALGAWAPTFTILVILRFLAGIGLGGTIPVDTALVAEFMPAARRGTLTGILAMGWILGTVAAGLAGIFLIRPFGWQWGLFVGGIAALFAVMLRRIVPESPRWLVKQGRQEEAERSAAFVGQSLQTLLSSVPPTAADTSRDSRARVSVATLFSRSYRKATIMAWGYFAFNQFAYYGFLFWLPTIFHVIFHVPLAFAFTLTLLTTLAQTVGRAFALYALDHWGRRLVFVIGFGMAGALALGYPLVNAAGIAVVLGMVMSFFNENAQVGTVVYTPELYPTAVRGTGYSWALSWGRISSAVAAPVFGYFFEIHAYTLMFICIGLGFLISALLVFWLGPETRGLTLEQSAHEVAPAP